MYEIPNLWVLFHNKFLFNLVGEEVDKYDADDLIAMVAERTHTSECDVYLTQNGRIISGPVNYNEGSVIRAVLRMYGGKGGFGSMLRAIGAQIEKTTNREACRDLSGRRLRDINEEQRLRKWLSKQQDRDKEAAERKKARLERLCAVPTASSTFKDASYDAERSALPERINDAIEAGLQASTSKSMSARAPSEPEGVSVNSVKRPATDNAQAQRIVPKKAKLWIDADLPDCSSDSDEDLEKAIA